MPGDNRIVGVYENRYGEAEALDASRDPSLLFLGVGSIVGGLVAAGFGYGLGLAEGGL